MVENRPTANAGCRLLAGLSLLVVGAGLGIAPAVAQVTADTTTIAAPERPHPAAAPAPHRTAARPAAAASSGSGQYYIEFRSRYAQSYGHTFLVHGRVGERLTHASVAGLHPAGDDPTPWVIGHFIPVPSETGWSDGDTEDKYITARYRVLMNKAQYDRVLAYIKELQARSPVWDAKLYNCNAFVADVAKFMGLKTPKSTLLYPKVFITNLRQINTGHPEAADQVFDENMKEMENPARDGMSARANGINVNVVRTERRKPATPTVTIGSVRVSAGEH